jgi:hypothetical protein
MYTFDDIIFILKISVQYFIGSETDA